MSSLIGILLDVSGSMRRNVGDGIDEQGGPWARSIFEVINNFIKHDVSSDNHVFAIGFGANRPGEEIFDILGTLQQLATLDHINMIFEILERAGARTIRKWAEVEVVRSVLTDYMAVLFLKKFHSDQAFLRKFVQEILPPACRDWPKDNLALPKIALFAGLGIATGGLGLVLGAAAGLYNLKGAFPEAAGSAYAWGMTKFKKATKEDIKEVLKKSKPHLAKKKEGHSEENDDYCIFQLKKVKKESIFNVQDASNVVHGYVDEKEISKEWSGELLRSVEPCIYGGTPLYQAIERATELFEKNASKFSSHKKLLFVVSDGQPTDGEATEDTRVDRLRSRLEKKEDVTVVSCLITKSKETDPRRLYSEMKPDWDKAAKFLFRLSSKLPTQFFVKRGWSIEIVNNETRLFLQVNHPDHMREACQVAREVVCSQDALSDLLVSVKLDDHINQTLEGYKAEEEQDGETCYANAAATVLHLAMSRILGRQDGYPKFDTLRQELIDCSDRLRTTSTLYVLQEICPKYHLRCKKVDLKGAMEAIASSRPVVARFRLTEYEWDRFEDFFKKESNRKSILTKEQIDITARPHDVPTDGHAVVLTSFNSECLRLLNSWGHTWADKGFFRVQNADVLGLDFIDVFLEEEDLTPEEKAYYKNHGSEVAKTLMGLLPSLQRAEYTCPNCKMASPVVEFTGTLLRAKCPKCEHEFSTDDAKRGNILALNIYLTSLCY